MTAVAPAGSKSERLLKYLEEIIRLRTKRVTSLESYAKVLWLEDLPLEQECFSRHRNEPEESDPELWIQVAKRREPVLPPLPEVCRPWIVDPRVLKDSAREPVLAESILVPLPVSLGANEPVGASSAQDSVGHAAAESSDDLAPKELRLADFPHVRAAWSGYLDREWRPWSNAHLSWRRVQSVYAALFEIWTALHSRGEQLELVLGVGCLVWALPDESIRRHVVTSRVSLSFDDKNGVFQIRPDVGGAALACELDMIPANRCSSELRSSSIQGLGPAGGDVWDRSSLDPVLSAIANQLSDRSEYSPDGLRPKLRADEEVNVAFAPALLLRSRTHLGAIEFIRRLQKQLESGASPTVAWSDLSETRSHEEVPENGSGGAQAGIWRGTASIADHECYMPLPANNEQRQILTALEHPMGALVQGPPGTGKSHTIANLICHLLATGKRILVTAQTARALHVLREKLPEAIRPLAVSVLGTAQDDQRTLEGSVQGIVGKLADPEARTSMDRSKAHDEARDLASKNAAALRTLLRQSRERDTRDCQVGGYKGTAERIARQLIEEGPRFAAFTDRIAHRAAIEVDPPRLLEAVKVLRKADEAVRTRLRLSRPTTKQGTPTADQLRLLVETERRAKEVLARHAAASQVQSGSLTGPSGPIAAAASALQRLDLAITEVGNRPQNWVERGLLEVLSNQDRPWFQLQAETRKSLDELTPIIHAEDRRVVEKPEGATWVQLRADALALSERITSRGKTPRLWWMQPASVRRLRYLTEAVRVDSRPAATAEALKSLVGHATAWITLERIWKLWGDKAAPSAESILLQVGELEELQESLVLVLGAYSAMLDAAQTIAAVQGLPSPKWTDEKARRWLQALLEHELAARDLHEAQRALSSARDTLKLLISRPGIDREITAALIKAIEERDALTFAKTVDESERLSAAAGSLVFSEQTLAEHSRLVPQFAAQIAANPSDPEWEARIALLPAAIGHIQAKDWLDEFSKDGDAERLEADLGAAEGEIAKHTEAAAALRAWSFAFDRMTDQHRRSLIQWQQAVKALGKGTGKHAFRHRRQAQVEIEACRPAIPAWIMPLHLVFDSIAPTPGAFDIVIIDEASQCGPDALPLFLLGKKVLIVGDDKQISPTYPGIDLSHVHQRMNELLPDFESSGGSFDLSRSLFDHGEARIGNRIVLREHFRCMPEIIRFSNDLCYSHSPLVPLRQYPPKRLTPLERRHVTDGYREGSTNPVNKPEAERLVDAVIACCRDPAYSRSGRKLSMGVVSLQGWAQAALIESLLVQRLGPAEVAARNLLCGDSANFQGDERDVIFLTMVIAPNMGYQTMAKFSDQQRFNVAASRARDQMWLFHSVDVADLGAECVRRKLLEHFIDPSRAERRVAGMELDELVKATRAARRDIDRPPAPFESWFEVDVGIDVASRGYRVVPQVEVAHYRIDLVIEGSDRRLAVECDGDRWHGAEQYEKDMIRQRCLERAGWTFVRVRGSAYYSNRIDAMDAVWRKLDALGIKPPQVTSPTTCPTENRNGEVGSRDASSAATVSDTGCVDAEPVESTNDAEDQVAAATEFDDLFDSADQASEAAGLVRVERYVEWRQEACVDPRDGATQAVIRGLLSIVTAEGPIVKGRAFQLYGRAAGFQRVGAIVRTGLNRALYKAIREGVLDAESAGGGMKGPDDVIRVAGSPMIKPRTAGTRALTEIPRSEIGWVALRLREQHGEVGDEALIRLVLEHYGFRRLREATKLHLLEILAEQGSDQSADLA